MPISASASALLPLLGLLGLSLPIQLSLDADDLGAAGPSSRVTTYGIAKPLRILALWRLSLRDSF